MLGREQGEETVPLQGHTPSKCRRSLVRRVSSFSLSITQIAKEIQEQSMNAIQLRTKRLGLICALFCALLGSIKGWMVSQLASIGPAQIFGLRSMGAVCFLLPIIIFRRSKVSFDLRTNFTLTLRSLAGNVAVAGYYYGFAYLPLAEASLIFYSTPIYTTLIGWLFLGERCDCSQAISLVLCIGGVTLVSSPTILSGLGGRGAMEFNPSLQGVVGCLIGALAQSVAIVILRRLEKVSAEVISFWWALTGAAVCVGYNGLLDSQVLWTCGYESSLVVLIAFIGFVSELAMVAALHLEEAGPVSVMLTSEILWAFVLQAGLQQEIPGLVTTSGAALILMSMLVPTVWTIYRRWKISRHWTKNFPDGGKYESLCSGNGSVQVVSEVLKSKHSIVQSP